MSRYWLLKTEPSEFSFADLQRVGRTVWDGVRHPLALKHLAAMRRGDRALIYHSGEDKQIVGVAEVVSEPYADPRAADGRRVVVEVRALEAWARPVPLAAIKERPEFADFELVRLPRLSVMPVSAARWKALWAMSRQSVRRVVAG
jgi:predicted RNA-binding protein with PUA-like domain